MTKTRERVFGYKTHYGVEQYFQVKVGTEQEIRKFVRDTANWERQFGWADNSSEVYDRLLNEDDLNEWEGIEISNPHWLFTLSILSEEDTTRLFSTDG